MIFLFVLLHLKSFTFREFTIGKTQTKADAPEVDAVVYLENATQLKPGDIVAAKITGADDYDLYATPA